MAYHYTGSSFLRLGDVVMRAQIDFRIFFHCFVLWSAFCECFTFKSHTPVVVVGIVATVNPVWGCRLKITSHIISKDKPIPGVMYSVCGNNDSFAHVLKSGRRENCG